MPATIEPPSHTPAPASVGTVMPPQPKEITLSAPSEPSTPPKPGSAKEAAYQRLRSKAGGATPPAPTEAPKETPKTESKNEQVKAPEVLPIDKPEQHDTPADKAPETETKGDPKKVSPWKLVDQFKQRALAAEQRALELEKQIIPENERTQVAERLTKAEQRAKELDDEMRYVKYEKSSEFKEKYEVPFQRSVGSAMKELNGLSFQDDKGTARQFDVNVLMELVNLPLHQARSISNTLFGDLANDVMTHRNRIRENLDEQAAAIDTAKKTGAERESQRGEQIKRYITEVDKFARNEFNNFKEELLKHPEHSEFFKPKEGDEEWNTRLEKGYDMVGKAFAVNVRDPNLTPEQRKEGVKLQAAVYNQAAAWRPMRLQIQRLTKERDAMRDELAKYKSTTPAAGGQAPQGTPSEPANARESMFARLRAKAAQ